MTRDRLKPQCLETGRESKSAHVIENALLADNVSDRGRRPAFKLVRFGFSGLVSSSPNPTGSREAEMTNDRSTRHDGSVKGRGRRAPQLRAGRNIEQQAIAIERSGDWLPAEELQQAALAALLPGKDVILNLDGVDHLDASALQILLALHAAQKKQGGNVQLVKASRRLRKWFDIAGVDGHFFHGR